MNSSLINLAVSEARLLKRIGYNLIRNVDHVEDIYQDFIVKFLRKQTVPTAGNLKGFLVTCWKNHCLNWKRSYKPTAVPRESDASYTLCTARFDLEQILSKKGRLSKRREKVLQLLLNGHTFVEIGKQLKLSPFTTRSHYLFLLKDLQTTIELQRSNYA